MSSTLRLAAAHGVRGRVEDQVVDGERRRARLHAAAQQRADAGQQHDEGERLGQVVVGAEVEGVGLVVLAVLRGQHEDRHPVLAAAQPLDDPVARQLGQHDVEDHRVVGRLLRQVQAVRAGVREVDGEALGAQARAAGPTPAGSRPRRSADAPCSPHVVLLTPAPPVRPACQSRHEETSECLSRVTVPLSHPGTSEPPDDPAAPPRAALAGSGRRGRASPRRGHRDVPRAGQAERPARHVAGLAHRRRAEVAADRVLRHRRLHPLARPARPAGVRRRRPGFVAQRRCSAARTPCRSGTAAPSKQRVALLGATDETDVFRNGRSVWQWSSADRRAVH